MMTVPPHCACRDSVLLKTMQIALASLKQLQTSTDTKLKEQVGCQMLTWNGPFPCSLC